MKKKDYPYICNIVSDGIGVDIYSTEPVFLNLRQKFKNDPFSGISVHQGEGNYPVKVIYEKAPETAEPEIVWSDQAVKIKAPLGFMNNGENFAYFALPLIEAEKQRRKMSTIHAASCVINGNGVLLLGKEGSGKTSIVYKLCKERGGALIGNDLTIIQNSESGLTLNEGSKFFFLRRASVEKSLPSLLSLFPDENKDNWLQKIKVTPDMLGISVARGISPLKKAFFVHIDENQEQLRVQSANILGNKLALNENFSRYIRSSCNTILDEDLNYIAYVPSFDKPEFFANRVQTINKLYNECALVYVSGKSDDISRYIYNETVRSNQLPPLLRGNNIHD